MVTRSGYKPVVADRLETDGTAAELIPETPTLEKLREAAASCRACDLWKTGTQTVFEEVRRTRRSSSLANNRATRKIRWAAPSSARPRELASFVEDLRRVAEVLRAA